MPEAARNTTLQKILDRGDEEKSFSKERQQTAQAFTLTVEWKDGRRSEGFAWPHYSGHVWSDNSEQEELTLIFGDRAVEIQGHNLKRLVGEIQEGRLVGVNELSTARQQLLKNSNPEDMPVISAIRVYPDVEEILREIKGEDDHGKGGHARRVQR